MSRYCGKTNPNGVLNAGQHWKSAALLGAGSVLTEKALWSRENLEAINQYYVSPSDEGDGRFLERLQEKLTPTGTAVKQLAAEMLWLMYLCPSSINAPHKRSAIERIWSWSGEAFPSESQWLRDDVLAGIGSAGPGFNRNQWRELAFLTRLMLRFRELPSDQQSSLLADPWRFAEWLELIEDAKARQLRHMLLFLLFPDSFERIFSQPDRRAVAVAFSDYKARQVNRLGPAALDRLLYDTRAKLEKKYATKELDYYVPPLAALWQHSTAPVVASEPTAEHVLKAIADIDRDGIPPGTQSKYDLVYGDKRYPAELVLSLAIGHATGKVPSASSFSAEAGAAFDVLRRLGLFVEPTDAIETLLRRFFEQAGRGDLGASDYLKKYQGLAVKVSFGQGNLAQIPWIAFLAEGEKVSEGIYPVLLFFREQRALALCYGVSETNRPHRAWSNIERRETVDTWYRREFGHKPKRYGSSYVRAVYRTDQSLPFKEINTELDLVIAEYQRLIGISTQDVIEADEVPVADVAVLEVQADLAAAAESFAAALREANVLFGRQHDELIRIVLASLVTKPFLILTGLSGSGKTQIAVRLGEWLGRRAFVAAVRPDWTGAEALFGYEDALRPVAGGRAAWSVPPPLEFMLKALRDPHHPYLLILDEMNLAHVERYFADVLSGMESQQLCLPNLTKESDGCWRVAAGADTRVHFPRNLWIIGTVNVDETTYMFSPKVLDRASTLEFRVASDDLIAEARKPTTCRPGDAALVRGLLSISKNDQSHESTAPDLREEFANRLRQLHRLLAGYGMEFGHRAFYECIRLAALLNLAGIGDRAAALDRIVLQRILPRLHGSRRKLEQPLLALAQFCRDLPAEVPAETSSVSVDAETLAAGAVAKLPKSHDKIVRMLRSLRLNQFASFTE
ncbi:McrB family protein [Peristeroidobacter soli]|uniref:McrB family protein n=1 Tax=Peristeroidobacter soli TaxID=2497877 RepID=UPI00101D623C|nr:DUF3578 domain-containing protein [Peristeroidobacter soli]